MRKPLVIVLTGPTASGKSALAVSLANKLHTEIISADSRQIYKGIPISTAVPSLEERGGIRHHLLECLELDEYFSASRFQEESDAILREIFKNNDTAIICGGSMLYIDTFINGIDELPTVPLEIRQALTEKWKRNGNEWLLYELKRLDPDYYDRVDRNNLKRIFHAIEITETAGRPYSSLLTGNSNKSLHEKKYEILKIVLTGSRNYLFDRINTRVLKMIETGLELEAKNVYPLRHLNSLNTVGLKEMFNLFEGGFTKEEAIARIQKNTRVYAKKQETWHKRDNKAERLDFAVPPDINVKKILDLIPRQKL